jgi:2-hydroxy-3-keto-5-methylthiopentenyl-1-phosphate phosphatase
MRPERLTKALFVDFDGTIVDADSAQIALDHFGDPDWMLIDEAFERDEVSFEESLRREFATLKAPPETIINDLRRVVALRPNFDRLLDYCRRRHLPITVVSGGLDFFIRNFLDRDDWLAYIQIYAPTSTFIGNGYSVTFPRMLYSFSTNFKDDLVMQEKRNGTQVAFAGNGSGDFAAAKESDLVFAIKGSKLAELCSEQRVEHEEIEDFNQVIDALDRRFREP